MFKIISFFAAFLLVAFIFVSCNESSVNEDTTKKVTLSEGGGCTVFSQTLWAGQSINVGYVEAYYDGESTLTVTYHIENGWTMTELHFDIEADEWRIPQNKKGNPQVGKFLINITNLSDTEYSFDIDLSQLNYPIEYGYDFTAAAHAIVEKTVDGSTEEETAWAEGEDFTDGTGSWAMYFTGYITCE